MRLLLIEGLVVENAASIGFYSINGYIEEGEFLQSLAPKFDAQFLSSISVTSVLSAPVTLAKMQA
ncbi:hypothetical protein [Vibrio sp. MEBiC08052]|uniref:hypothetical protein n=1 Tax=Vibrio sp. MEBiC08052 TaxID=1761910 RepID=UPI0007405D64|nr:hypothetical protein [Vibrio sp. MEBiC08052]KUI97707.1 hypothetical protein VRK_32700 [Vibrio sp. MEBiC08052]